jgi:hypothetical protein
MAVPSSEEVITPSPFDESAVAGQRAKKIKLTERFEKSEAGQRERERQRAGKLCDSLPPLTLG